MADTLRLAGKNGKIGVLATFAPTIASIKRELEEMVAASGASVEIFTRHVSHSRRF